MNDHIFTIILLNNHLFKELQWAEDLPTIKAITIAIFLAYGKSSDSFGPCALELGPNAPVTNTLALGNALARQFTIGISAPKAQEYALDPKICFEDQ